LPQFNDIIIRNDLQSGDIGYIIYLHGKIYKQEYDYGIEFERYVAKGLLEFYQNYDPQKDRIWICEHQNKIIGSLVLMHRENHSAQLRYFLIHPQFRGLGLGKKLMESFLNFLEEHNYQSCFCGQPKSKKRLRVFIKSPALFYLKKKKSDAFGKKVKEQRYDLILKKMKT
jgi:peptidyl-dipeptidase Dcp